MKYILIFWEYGGLEILDFNSKNELLDYLNENISINHARPGFQIKAVYEVYKELELKPVDIVTRYEIE
jgi:hypothetical protein